MIKSIVSAGLQELTKPLVEMGKRKLSKLVGNVEQLLFDSKNINREVGGIFAQEGRELLRRVHAGDSEASISFEKYLDNLETFMSADDQYSVDLYNLMSSVGKSGDPVASLESIVEMEAARRGRENYVGRPEEVILPDDFWREEMKRAEVEPVPDSYLLRNEEFQNISSYFRGDTRFSQLSIREQTLTDSLRLNPDEFAKNFPDAVSQTQYHELRTQLKNELINQNVLSMAEIREIENVKIPFSVTMDNYNTKLMMANGIVSQPEWQDPRVATVDLEGDILRNKQDQYQKEIELRNLVKENPELSNEALIRKFQQIPENPDYDLNERFQYYYDMFDDERNINSEAFTAFLPVRRNNEFLP